MPIEIISANAQRLGERRLARIELDTFQLIQMMQEGYKANFETIRGLPDGAVFIASYYNQETQITSFIFYHPSFQEVEIGSAIPAIYWVLQNAY